MVPISIDGTIIADSPMISTSNITPSAPGAPPAEGAAEATADQPQEQLPPSPQTDPQAPASVPAMAQTFAQGPPLGSVFLRRLSAVPLVRGLGGVCGRVAGWPLVGCSLALLRLVSAPAVAVVGPVAGVCAVPAACVDWCACKGLDVVEQVAPCLFVPSDEVLTSCATCLSNCACCLPKAGANAVNSVCRCGEEKQHVDQ